MWFSQEGDSFHVTPDSFIYLMIIAIKIQKGNISVEKKKKKKISGFSTKEVHWLTIKPAEITDEKSFVFICLLYKTA